MNNNEYQCEMCKGIFENDWSDEESMQECVDNFGPSLAACGDNVIICDDCYQLVNPKNHPDLVALVVSEHLREKSRLIPDNSNFLNLLRDVELNDLEQKIKRENE